MSEKKRGIDPDFSDKEQFKTNWLDSVYVRKTLSGLMIEISSKGYQRLINNFRQTDFCK